MVVVRDGRIGDRVHRPIPAPRKEFHSTDVHGITWHKVRSKPLFAEAWQDLAPALDGVEILAAHSAHFDRSVSLACCGAVCTTVPTLEFICTVRVPRSARNLRPTTVPAVCEHLDLPLEHHDALSDAEACAGIVLAVAKVMAAERVLKVGTARSREFWRCAP